MRALPWPEDVVAAWVEASCREQDVPPKVVDVVVVNQICVLLGGSAETRPAAAEGARPAARGTALQPPDGFHARRIEASGAGRTGQDHGMVEQGANDRNLPVEIKAVPRSA